MERFNQVGLLLLKYFYYTKYDFISNNSEVSVTKVSFSSTNISKSYKNTEDGKI